MTTNALNIDMSDPSVRRMISGNDEENPLAPKKRSMVQLAGDAPDPTGRMAGRGLQSTHRLDTGKIEVLVAYRGKQAQHADMTVDVYAIPGQPMELHLICPKCHHKSRVTAERKKIEFDENDVRPFSLLSGETYPTNGGRLDVATFECGWEMPDAGKHTPGIKSGGITLCRMRLTIDHNQAKDS